MMKSTLCLSTLAYCAIVTGVAAGIESVVHAAVDTPDSTLDKDNSFNNVAYGEGDQNTSVESMDSADEWEDFAFEEEEEYEGEDYYEDEEEMEPLTLDELTKYLRNDVLQIKQDDPLSFDVMIAYLRDDDDRLIRPSPTESTVERQENACVVEYLEMMVLPILVDHDASIENRKKAAQVARLCAADHPGNHDYIGGFPGVIGALVSLVEAPLEKMHVLLTDLNGMNQESVEDHLKTRELSSIKESVKAAAAAAEAIWILAFDNEDNYAEILDDGAIDSLSALLIACPPELVGECNHAKMWAAAALQNLAASYCDSELGSECFWGPSADGGVGLHEANSVTIDGEPARKEILEVEGLVGELSSLVCAGPASVPMKDSLPWPSRSLVNRDEMAPSIVAWAAAGALKNLAVSQPLHEEILSAKKCLCDMSFSQDWMEASIAKEAIYHMGLEGTCGEAPYYQHCRDNEWSGPEDETCQSYEENQWCGEFGDLEDEEGVSANRACCACGGGASVTKHGAEF